jgi:hypothetical protein
MHHPTQYEMMAKNKMGHDLRQSAAWRLEQRAHRMQIQRMRNMIMLGMDRLVRIMHAAGRHAVLRIREAVSYQRGRRMPTQSIPPSADGLFIERRTDNA